MVRKTAKTNPPDGKTVVGPSAKRTKAKNGTPKVNGTAGLGDHLALGAKPSAKQAFLAPRSNDFWHAIGVFPAALERIRSIDSLPDDAVSILRKLGTGNLRLLCEQSRLPKPDDAGESALTATLLAAADVPTVIHLREFMRRRTGWVENVFDRGLPARLRTSLDVDLKELSPRRNEVLKPFTKLLLLYRDDPKWIAEVYHQAEWYRRNSSFEYRTHAPLPRNVKQLLKDNVEEIRKAIARTLNRGLEAIGVHELIDGTIICSFVREYAKVARPDFAETYTLHHGCGLLVFGVAPEQSSVIIKCGNREVAATIIRELQRLLKAEFRLLKNEVFSDFTGDDIRQRFLGGYAAEHGVAVTEAVLLRCSLAGTPKLRLTAGPYQSSIRDALTGARDQGLADVFGPGDVESITVTFRGQTAHILSEPAKEGAVRFVFETGGWEPSLQAEFEDAFLNTFGIPLNRLLDPSRTVLGTEGVFAHLLGISSEEEVQPYQEDCFETLVERGMLVRKSTRTRMCRNGICDQYKRPVTDETQQVCRKCDEELDDVVVESIVRSEDGMARVIGDMLHDADAWSLGEPKELDGHWYRPLEKKTDAGRENTICVIFHDKLSTGAKRTFKRTGLPLLVVHGRRLGQRTMVDDEGIAHVSLAHVLASQQDAAAATMCIDECREVIKRLLLRHEERILQAAGISHDRLLGNLEDFDGDAYEDDIFNVLRSVFPYTYKLGRKGKVEPDGYVCIPDYQSNSLRNVGSWNWSYDAKLSNRRAGYQFKIEEQRKVVQYIRRLSNNRRALFGDKQRPRAHVLISNNLAEDKLKRAAEHIFGPEGVGDEGGNIRFLLMQQEFLTTLYEGVRNNVDAIRRRRPFLDLYLIKLLEATPIGWYAVLGRTDADDLMQDVLACQEIETNIDPVKLSASLDEESKPRSKRRPR